MRRAQIDLGSVQAGTGTVPSSPITSRQPDSFESRLTDNLHEDEGRSMQKFRGRLVCVAAVLLGLAGSARWRESAVGRKVEPFTLKDFRGKDHSLKELLAQSQGRGVDLSGDRVPAGEAVRRSYARAVRCSLPKRESP